MNKIIIYGSKYGTAKLYAQKLSEEIGISVKSFKEVENIDNYDIIIYLGALYAGGVLGMAKTLKKLNNLSNKNIIIATVGLADPIEKIEN